jgi:hypothetical protein
MDPLMRDLRDLDPSAPPAAVDLDRVITRGLRRRAATRFGAVSGVVATVLGLVTTAVVLQPAANPGVVADGQCRAVPTQTYALPSPSGPTISGSPGPGGSGSPGPNVSGSPGPNVSGSPGPNGSGSPVLTSSPTTPGPPTGATLATINRLNAALRPALAAAFPGMTIVADGTCDEDWTLAVSHTGGYWVVLDVYDAAGRQSLSVRVWPGRPISARCDDNNVCVSVTATEPTARSGSHDFGNGNVSLFALGDLANGTVVNVDVRSSSSSIDDNVFVVTRQGVSLTEEAAKRLALTPGLTLNP